MQQILLLGLLGSALAHPARVHKPWKPALSKRTVDLDQYRLHSNNTYVAAKEISSDAAARVMKRESYVDTATALVQSVVPGAEFRVADSYVGSNGVAVSFVEHPGATENLADEITFDSTFTSSKPSSAWTLTMLISTLTFVTLACLSAKSGCPGYQDPKKLTTRADRQGRHSLLPRKQLLHRCHSGDEPSEEA